MKYKPRNSNFDEMQDDFADEVLGACRSYNDALESLKDLVAKTIDDYLDAIIKEHLEERSMIAIMGREPYVMFSLGENNLPDGTIDCFYTEKPLREILNECDPQELDEIEQAAATAEMFEYQAARFRKREQEIIHENAEWAAKANAPN